MRIKERKMKSEKKRLALSERSESKGFTLIEVLIAVLILALAVAAAVIVERSSLRSDSLHRHRFQATGLAQQGLNLARSIRDTNVIGGATGGGIWDNLGYVTVDPT